MGFRARGGTKGSPPGGVDFPCRARGEGIFARGEGEYWLGFSRKSKGYCCDIIKNYKCDRKLLKTKHSYKILKNICLNYTCYIDFACYFYGVCFGQHLVFIKFVFGDFISFFWMRKPGGAGF